MSVLAVYTAADGSLTKLELQGDPFEVCNAVRQRMFPGVPLADKDEKFDAVMATRKKALSTAAKAA